MQICNKCNLENKIKKPNLQCEKCLNNYKNEWSRKKKNRLCSYCKKPYIPKGKDKQCSLHCKLLGNITKNGDCWEWNLCQGRGGYGKITINRKTKPTHKVSFEFFKKEFDKELLVCHKCDNRKCINPDHLWQGTQKENIEDCIRKNRKNTKSGWKHSEETKEKFKNRKRNTVYVKGIQHGGCKLKEKDVMEIRQLSASGMKQKEISNKFNVHSSTISNIVRGKYWKRLSH